MIVNKSNASQNASTTTTSQKKEEQVGRYVSVAPDKVGVVEKWEKAIERFTEDLHPSLRQDKERKAIAAAVLENSYKSLTNIVSFMNNWQNELKMGISESILNSDLILNAIKRVRESAGVTTPSITSGAVATFLAPIIVRTLYKMNAVDMFEVQPLQQPVGVFNYAMFEYETDTKEYPNKTFVNLPGQLFTINPYYATNVFEVRIAFRRNNNTYEIYTPSANQPQIFPEVFRDAVAINYDQQNDALYIKIGHTTPSGNAPIPANPAKSLQDIEAIHNLPQQGFFFQQKPQYIRVFMAYENTSQANYNLLNWEFYVRDRQIQTSTTRGIEIVVEQENGFVVKLNDADSFLPTANGEIGYIRILYTTDYEQFGKNPPIPSIGLRIAGIPVTVEQRPIRAKYTLEAERDLSAYFKMNIYEAMTNFLVTHIAGEIDRRLIFEAQRSAYRYIEVRLANLISGNNNVINFQTIRDVIYTIILQIQAAANDILRFNKIAKGNWIVTSVTTGALFELMSETDGYLRNVDVSIPQTSTLTPTKVGRIGDIDVYVDAMLPDGFILVGTKVPNDIAPFGGGVALLPYALMPAHYDDLGKPVIAPDTFTRHVGFVSRDAIVTVPFGNYYYAIVDIKDIDRISGFLGNFILR